MTCFRPLIYFERGSECYTVFIILNLFIVYETETLTAYSKLESVLRGDRKPGSSTDSTGNSNHSWPGGDRLFRPLTVPDLLVCYSARFQKEV